MSPTEKKELLLDLYRTLQFWVYNRVPDMAMEQQIIDVAAKLVEKEKK